MIKLKQVLLRQRVDFEGTLDDVIARLQQFKIDYPDYITLKIIDDVCYDGGMLYELYGEREETVAEEVARINLEKVRSHREEENERRQYELLKAKFEKDGN